MSEFTAEQAINAGLVTELMTEIIQPLPPEEPITPTKFSGSYKLERKLIEGNFAGYELAINQDYLNAESISGTFSSTEEIIKFGEEMKNAGVTVNFLDDFSGSVLKLTADIAIEKDLITNVQEGLTSLQGSFEVSEGVATFKQKPFKIKIGNSLVDGAFLNIDELSKMIEKFLWLDSLKPAERNETVRKDLNRNNLNYTQKFRDSLTPKPNLSERVLERNPAFWADIEKNITDLQEKLNRSPLSEKFQANLGVQRFKSFQVPRLRHRF